MSANEFTVKWNKSFIKRVDKEMEPILTKAMGKEALKILAQNAPRRSGKLAKSFLFKRIAKWQIKVFGTSGYSALVELGTGLYGPYKTKITPTVKRALMWEGAAHPYGATRGQHAQPFFVRSIRQLRVNLKTVFRDILE